MGLIELTSYKMPPRFNIAALALAIGLLLSWLLLSTPPKDKQASSKPKPATQTSVFTPSDPQSDRKPRVPSSRGPEFDPKAIPNERIVSFDSEQAYREFLKKLGRSNLRNLGQIDALRAVRIGFNSLADFDALDLDPGNIEFNYPVNIPENSEVAPQDGLVGFGASAFDFLGITADNSNWGRGVKIAIIDTGISPHIALTGNIQHINLVDLPDGVSPHSHGTSVASLIAGTHPNMKGVAPAADLISVRVANEFGSSNSALLAQGIIAAADAGAQPINISMGSDGDSQLVRRAIEYAIEKGAVVFASSGNEGSTQASSPARDPNVYSVGAVDANGTHLNFSSSDSDLAFTAPGLDIRAALPGDNVTSFTGTSAAVAYPVGAVAAIMSESPFPISAQQAVTILQNYTNEAGSPGRDSQFGFGIIDIGRAINRNTPGIVDVAVASQTYLLPTAQSSTSGLQVSVENRGTEIVYQTTVDINIGGDLFPYTIQSLQPNERTIVTIPAGQGQLLREGSLPVSSQVNLSNGSRDSKPSNDRRQEVILSSTAQPDGP